VTRMLKLKTMTFPKFEQPNNIAGPKTTEMSAEDISYINEARGYWNSILDNGEEDYNGPLFGDKEEIRSSWKNKEEEKKESLELMPENEKWEEVLKLKQQSEYEILKEQIDYKNQKLSEMMAFLEKQPIWKYKFSTDNSSGRTLFAGQNLDSIYFLSHSGVTLRLKKENYLTDLRGVLKQLDDVCIFIDQKCNLIHDISRSDKEESIPAEFVSFEPKTGYRVQEYFSKEFLEHQNGAFKSKITLTEQDGKIKISNFDGDHSGHIINNIESL